MSEFKFEIINDDCLNALKKYPDNYFDSIVTDPPYGISFLNKKWDYEVPSVEIWKESLRVLKPGGHILSACGTRTQHRMAVNIEDAGFELRDIISWVYASGFPKALDISKGIDEHKGLERKVIGQRKDILEKQAKDLKEGKRKIVESLNFGAPERNNGFITASADVTEPNSPEAKQFSGWKTQLKPAQELWTLARKPISENTVVENILKWGVGALNIDGCRIAASPEELKSLNENRQSIRTKREGGVAKEFGMKPEGLINSEQSPNGRFPANIIFECICNEVYIQPTQTQEPEEVKGGIWHPSEGKPAGRTYKGGIEIHTNPNCPCYQLNKQSGILTSGQPSGQKNVGNGYRGNFGQIEVTGFGDTGGASRFFYCAKSSQSERNKGLENIHDKDGKEKHNIHPTIKPINLMKYLCRLITPPGGIVLDPFNGSGTTGIACKLEGFNYIGIEKEKEYCDISIARINAWKKEEDNQLTLF